MSGLIKIRGNTVIRFPLYHGFLIVEDVIKLKKAIVGALGEPWECTWT